jgi:hypothetical protein
VRGQQALEYIYNLRMGCEQTAVMMTRPCFRCYGGAVIPEGGGLRASEVELEEASRAAGRAGRVRARNSVFLVAYSEFCSHPHSAIAHDKTGQDKTSKPRHFSDFLNAFKTGHSGFSEHYTCMSTVVQNTAVFM